jgi:hypothetical protein
MRLVMHAEQNFFTTAHIKANAILIYLSQTLKNVLKESLLN